MLQHEAKQLVVILCVYAPGSNYKHRKIVSAHKVCCPCCLSAVHTSYLRSTRSRGEVCESGSSFPSLRQPLEALATALSRASSVGNTTKQAPDALEIQNTSTRRRNKTDSTFSTLQDVLNVAETCSLSHRKRERAKERKREREKGRKGERRAKEERKKRERREKEERKKRERREKEERNKREESKKRERRPRERERA